MIDKVVFVFLAALSVTNALYVPQGFELVVGELDKKYLVASSQGPFLEAFVTCRGYGYELASVSSAEENWLLNSTLAQNTNYWIGGINYEQVFEGSWSWIGSRENVNFTNWAPSEPARGNGINGILVKSGLWYAYPITLGAKFICEV